MHKGYSLLEALIALALSAALFTGGFSSLWLARQRLQLSVQQAQAATLLTEVLQLLASSTDTTLCDQGCLWPAGLDNNIDQLLQAYATQLPDLQLCLLNPGAQLTWTSSIQRQTDDAVYCQQQGQAQLWLR